MFSVNNGFYHCHIFNGLMNLHRNAEMLLFIYGKEQKQEKRTKPLFYSMSSQNHFDAEKVHLDTSNEANPNVNHILHSRSKWTKYTRHRQQQQIWKGSKSNSIAVFVRLKNLIKVLDKIVSQRPVPKCWILDWHSSQFNAKNMLLDTMRLCNRTTKPSRFICFST